MPRVFTIKRLNSHTLLLCQIALEVSKHPEYQDFITQAGANQRLPPHLGCPTLCPCLAVHPSGLLILSLPTWSGCPELCPLSVLICPSPPLLKAAKVGLRPLPPGPAQLFLAGALVSCLCQHRLLFPPQGCRREQLPKTHI